MLGLSVGCASGGKTETVERKDILTISTGTSDQKRPYWTYEGDLDMKKVHADIGDNPAEPKHMVVITKATVAKEELIPNCYNMARARAGDETASTVSELVKSSSSMASSSDATEFQKVISSQSNQFIIGAEVANKTWVKILDEGDTKFHCWVMLKMPRKNLKKLQEIVEKQLQKEMGGEPDLKERVKAAQDKMQSEF